MSIIMHRKGEAQPPFCTMIPYPLLSSSLILLCFSTTHAVVSITPFTYPDAGCALPPPAVVCSSMNSDQSGLACLVPVLDPLARSADVNALPQSYLETCPYRSYRTQFSEVRYDWDATRTMGREMHAM